MPVQPIRPSHDLLHESEMTGGHIKVPAVTGKSAGFREDRNIHKERIAPPAMQRHELPERSVCRKSAARCTEYQFGRPFVSRSASNFIEQHVRRERTL